ncbi:hypothetical protein TraAM80_08858 [Trypanosoma rangeli]|uniref:Uncharacterized protein n=1 Tax=Trypanosoma rangeli TaxID=5698 RepID=A0A3R7K0K7_TRYRA|nr:uncharacterized protein TraAM80_08858 [Trypanosoma rangeli]RNE98496.1 hypothetical protein TraAM80_08858 [Trypanosoma rangeli]|eukprot:RNE98496.1 hypothetical protein TraAM80_08858 [Trypanosoma rangeli]
MHGPEMLVGQLKGLVWSTVVILTLLLTLCFCYSKYCARRRIERRRAALLRRREQEEDQLRLRRLEEIRQGLLYLMLYSEGPQAAATSIPTADPAVGDNRSPATGPLTGIPLASATAAVLHPSTATSGGSDADETTPHRSRQTSHAEEDSVFLYGTAEYLQRPPTAEHDSNTEAIGGAVESPSGVCSADAAGMGVKK